ncbi:hypothetical protein IAT40_007899 [Kwoniella sp. CBS 6097]
MDVDVEMDASFTEVIDPSLASPDAFSSTALSPAPPVDGDADASAQSSDLILSQPSLSKSNGKKRAATNAKTKEKAPKAKKAAPGSAADFRRREANRLAAERSRSRASEKAVALENARKSLDEENERLKVQIAQLEGDSGIRSTNENEETIQQLPHPQETNQDDQHPLFGNETQAHSTEIDHERPDLGSDSVSAPATLDDHASHISHDHTEDNNHDHDHDHAQRQEQEAHSHTILAALTDITGVDFSEGNDASWMQGMESFLKESDASGRLGELAAVASGANGDGDVIPDQEQSAGNPFTTTTRQAVEASLQLAEERRFKMPIPAGPVNNAVTVLAAAINTEMERLIMEDLADTKAAIVQVEKQIAALRQGREVSSEDTDFLEPESSLPASILTTNLSSLSALAGEVQSNISQVQNDLPGLHEELGKLRDEKTGEADQLNDLITQVKAVTITIDDEEEMNRFTASLKAVGGLVESLLSDEKLQPDLSYASGTYSSPAIARRRRGRPPKGDNPRTFYQSFLLSPSSSSRTEHVVTREPKPKPQPKPKKPKAILRERLATRPRRSRLGQHVHLPEPEAEVEAEAGAEQAQEEVQAKDVQEDLRQLQAHAQAAAQEQEQEREQVEVNMNIDPQLTDANGSAAQTNQAQDRVLVQATPNQDLSTSVELNANPAQVTDEATADAVNRAEAFILSQLDSQQDDHVQGHEEHEHDHRDHHIPPLDSTSFADFLPAQEELERQAGQNRTDFSHQPSLDISIGPTATTQVLSNDQQPLSQMGAAGGAAASQPLSESSVLARLKKGPPGSCDICMRTETTVWRKLSLGTQDLKVCNACGTYHHKFGVIRPPELWNDGKSIRRRRTNPRPSTALTEGEGGEEGERDTASPRPRKRVRKSKRAQEPVQVQVSAEDLIPTQSEIQSQFHPHSQSQDSSNNQVHEQGQVQGAMESAAENADVAVAVAVAAGAESEVGADGQGVGVEDLSEEGRRAVLDAALIQGLKAIEDDTSSMIHDSEHEHEQNHQVDVGVGIDVDVDVDVDVGADVVVEGFEDVDVDVDVDGHEHDEGLREVVQAVQAARMAMAQQEREHERKQEHEHEHGHEHEHDQEHENDNGNGGNHEGELGVHHPHHPEGDSGGDMANVFAI